MDALTKSLALGTRKGEGDGNNSLPETPAETPMLIGKLCVVDLFIECSGFPGRRYFHEVCGTFENTSELLYHICQHVMQWSQLIIAQLIIAHLTILSWCVCPCEKSLISVDVPKYYTNF